jgi:hypothetical protein
LYTFFISPCMFPVPPFLNISFPSVFGDGLTLFIL